VQKSSLQLVEISEKEKELLIGLLRKMCNPRDGLSEAKNMVSRLREDVLERGFLENRRLNRNETLAQLSTWCHASAKHIRVKPTAQEVSKLLFAGNILPRLVEKSGKTVSGASGLLNKFIDDVLRDQEGYASTNTLIDLGVDDTDETEDEFLESPPTTVSVETDLRKHIAFDPTMIEEGLKTIKEEYPTKVGRIDVLCEDSNGNLVVVELKKGREGDKVVGQTLRYMGWLKEEQKRTVRGIIILGEPDDRVRYAVAVTPDIEVKYYRVHFDITEEPPKQE